MDDYRFGKTLGKGAFGFVCLLTHADCGEIEQHVVKVIDKSQRTDVSNVLT